MARRLPRAPLLWSSMAGATAGIALFTATRTVTLTPVFREQREASSAPLCSCADGHEVVLAPLCVQDPLLLGHSRWPIKMSLPQAGGAPASWPIWI